MSIPTVQDLLQIPYVKQFFLLLPLAIIGGLITFLLQRGDALRRGAGLAVPEPPTRAAAPPQPNEPPPLVPLDDLEAPGDDDIPPAETRAGGLHEFLEEDDGVPVGADDNLWDRADDDGNDVEQAGPANQQQQRQRASKVVGKKKARNLEIRDRRRAYNEFLQQQAQDRREREQALDDEQEEKLYEERRRRALAEIKIEEARQREREEKREAKEQHAKLVAQLRAQIERLPATGKVSLRALGHRVGKDEAWVKKTISEERIALGGSEKCISSVTESGWLIRIGEEEMRSLAAQIKNLNQASWEDTSRELDGLLQKL